MAFSVQSFGGGNNLYAGNASRTQGSEGEGDDNSANANNNSDQSNNAGGDKDTQKEIVQAQKKALIKKSLAHIQKSQDFLKAARQLSVQA